MTPDRPCVRGRKPKNATKRLIGELILINNALNEVRKGIHMNEGELQTRLGVSVEDARRLRRRIQALLDS